MKIKTFYGDTMREALDLVKRDLGSNALILSSRHIKARPGQGRKIGMVYEVTAALDLAAEPAESDTPTESGSTANHRARPASVSPRRRPRVSYDAAAAASYDDTAHDMDPALRRELRQLRRLIYSLAQPALRPGLASDAPSYEVYCELIANDIDAALACQLIDGAKTHLAGQARATKRHWAQAVQHLASDMISVAPIEEALSQTDAGGRIAAAFIGPTGVGKTTTVAKLAARYALELTRKVLLVTLDTYRIAAIEQLRTYASIIGVPLEVVSTIPELDRVLAQNLKMDVVLIDTIGCSPRAARRMNDLACYLSGAPSIQKHLVLSATTKPIDLEEIIAKFAIFSPTNLLFTKLDETSTFGPIFNELVRTRKPLSYLTSGQKVPEDLSIPTPRDVASLIVSSMSGVLSSPESGVLSSPESGVRGPESNV